MVQINCFWNRDQRYYTANHWKGTIALDGGTLYTQFSHFIDMMYWLFGDIEHIHAEFEDLNHQKTTEFEDT
ncbi:MAG: gfo/Idh/MocA family oxidoreductase, partial [Bacteroidetes bacterium]|nr:gfo/Idh/MocA family oxidoreductase [Bacteroidota bacterium]